MVEMTNKEYQAALKTIGVSYLGNFSQTAKMVLNEKVGGVITYNIYLAPWKLAGFINGHEINVCPRGEHCAPYCLNASGHNKAEILYRGIENSRINNARIKKTRLFYTDRELFMRIMIFEMKSAMRYAAKRDMEFSVRLNRLMTFGKKADLANYREVFSFPGDMIKSSECRPKTILIAGKLHRWECVRVA